MGLNWFMPAFVKRRVGSSYGTHGEEGREVWPGYLGGGWRWERLVQRVCYRKVEVGLPDPIRRPVVWAGFGWLRRVGLCGFWCVWGHLG